MQNAASGQPPVLNSNGTSTPSHIPPQDQTAAAAKRTAALLLNPPEQASQAPVSVQGMVDEIAQKQANKDEIARRVSAKLGGVQTPEPVAEPVTVAREQVTDSASLQQDPVLGPEEQPQETPDLGVEVSPEAEVNPKAEDFKKVRSALKQTKLTVQDLLNQKTELETKITRYETGEELPPPVKDLKERVAKLEPLEHLLNLKTSDAYQEKFVEPLRQATDRLTAIANDYGLPAEVMEKAAQITNRRDLNAFLLDHFDEVGALEAKQVIGDVQKIRTELAQAEAEPSKALERITQERLALKAQEEQKRVGRIAETGKTSWMSALLDLRQEGKIQEIIPRENDPEFNSKWVEPITKKASEQYGALITSLGQAGIKELDPEVGKGLGKLCTLATVAATAIARANAAEAELEAVLRNTERTSSMLRPGVGMSRGGSVPSAQASKPASPKDAARALLRGQGVRI